MKKLCVIYANCQGRGIAFFLERSEAFQSIYRIEIIENYKLIADSDAVPVEQLATTDLFIHQPVANRHGPYSTPAMLSLLGNDCRSISFPYIYNDALWPLFEEGEVVKGKEVILGLIEQGLSLKQIADRFCGGGIDFGFEDRFRRSINILRAKEAVTDVKVADFIVRNLSEQKLFLTQNHQTSAVYLHCVNQMLAILRLPSLPVDDRWHPNATGLPDCWPASPYDRSYY